MSHASRSAADLPRSDRGFSETLRGKIHRAPCDGSARRYRSFAGSSPSSACDRCPHRQVQLVGVVLGVAAVLRAASSEDAARRNALLVKEGHHAVVEQTFCPLAFSRAATWASEST